VVGVEGGRWRAFESIVVGSCSAGTDDGAIAEPASTDDPRSGVELGSRGRGVWRHRLLLGGVRGLSADP
jgi:hypothetical protein